VSYAPLFVTVLVMIVVVLAAMIPLWIVDAVRHRRGRMAAIEYPEVTSVDPGTVDSVIEDGLELRLQLGPLDDVELERIYRMITDYVQLAPVSREMLVHIVGVSRRDDIFVDGTADFRPDPEA
jgi:hypothetical protein